MQIHLSRKENPIDKAIKDITIKIWLERIIGYLCMGLMAFAVIVLLLVVMSKFFHIIFLEHKILKILLGVVIAFLLIGTLHKPSLKDGAMAGDLLGLQDRLATYLEFKDKHNAVVSIFIEDLNHRLEKTNLVKRYKVKFDIKRALVSILILCLSVTLFFLPSRQLEATKEIEKNHEIIKDEAKNISALKKDVAEGLEGKEKDAAVEVLEKLEKELEKTFDVKDAALKVNTAQGQIEDIFEKSGSQRQSDGLFEGDVGHIRADSAGADLGGKSPNSGATSENRERKLETSQKNITNIPKGPLTDQDMGKVMSEKTGSKGIGSKSYDDEKERNNQHRDDIISSLQESKERLTSKAYDGMKTKEGKDELSSFALGERDEYKKGESSGNSSKDKMSGGSGKQDAKDADAVGQGKDRASGKGDGKTGFSDKNAGDSSVNDFENGDSELQITGQRDKSGKMVQDKKGEVAGTKGDTPVGKRIIGDFGGQDFDYVIDKKVPKSKRGLVIKYFNLLKGVKENGR